MHTDISPASPKEAFWVNLFLYTTFPLLATFFLWCLPAYLKEQWQIIEPVWLQYRGAAAARSAARTKTPATPSIERYPAVNTVHLHPDYFRRRLAGQSALLALPGEMKNEIYRLVLVKADREPIRVVASPQGSTTPSEPAFLRTCHSLRTEALRIYYLENIFVLDALDMDPSLAIAFYRISLQHSVELDIVVLRHGLPRWCNLSRWLREFHGSRAYGLTISVESDRLLEDTETQIVESMFRVANTLKVHSWRTTESVLNDLRAPLVSEQPGWADD